MITSGILKSDIFSWFVKGKYWMSHEWLFEVLLFFLKNIFGKYHVYIYSIICMGSIIFLLYFLNKKGFSKNIPYSLIYLLFFFLIFNVFNQARPHLLSFILFIISFYCLYDNYKNEESKKIYILPLISILWSNIHGGSSNLGYLLCLIFIIGGSFSFSYSKIEAKRLTKKQYKKYFIVMILSMIGVCINIHGVRMFIYPYLNMLDTTMISNISEWRTTSLQETYHYVFFAYILFIIFTFLFSKKKIDFIDLILFLFGTYLGLKSIRFWAFPYMIMTFIIFSYVKERKIDKGTNNIIIIISLLFIFLGIFIFKEKGFVSYSINFNNKDISIIKKEKPKRLFNMYDYGGELIYNDILVFIDGRADLYSKYNYKDYLEISRFGKNSIKLIEKYNFDYFLVSKNYPIALYLDNSLKYEKIYSRDNLVFYKTKYFS